ncbi:MAG: glycosyltransferase [Candidatus Heimdallarchaeota archaeon]|nr:glycosyltransferase [Candidatus Heimdallarchaeota archaeon]
MIIRTYNRRLYLVEALESVRDQTCKDYEIIVVDDGSTDGTRELLESMDDISLIKKNRSGIVKTLNQGVMSAKGDYIAILDDDDLWESDFLEKCLDIFDKHPDAAIVYSDYNYFYDNDTDKLFHVRKQIAHDNLLGSLIYANFIVIPAAVIKRNVFDETGLFDENLLSHEEWDMWLRMAIAGLQFKYISEALVKIRKHPSGITTNRLRMFQGALSVLEKYKNVVPSKYRDNVDTSINRLSNILAVLTIAMGKRSEGIKDLYENSLNGNFKSFLYLLTVSFLPATILRRVITLYEKSLLIPAPGCSK